MSTMLALFNFTLRQCLRDLKFWLTVVALFLPCVLVGVVRYFGPAQSPDRAWMLYQGLTHFMLLLVLVPLASMIYGTGLIGAEVESRTITYLITRRLRRRTVLAVRFVAIWIALTAACWAGLVALHLCVVARRNWTGMDHGTLGGWNVTAELFDYMVLIPVAVGGFLAVFALIGIVFSRPLAWSLVYFVMFELILGNIPADVNQYSLVRHLRGWAVTRVANLERLNPEMMIADSGGLRNVILVGGVSLILACVWIGRRELVPGKVARD